MSAELREAQRRQEYRAEIMRGYQAALCNHGIPGWTLGDEVAKVADNLLAAHPVEPAPAANCEVEEACEVMHDAYERAAIVHAWETDPASRHQDWAEVPEANKATMRDAVRALLNYLAPTAAGVLRSEAEVKAEALEEAAEHCDDEARGRGQHGGTFTGRTLRARAAALRAGDHS